jgi:sterol 14-demethylase
MEYEEMKDLDVLNSVIRETLRMHPPIHSIMVSFSLFSFWSELNANFQRKVISDMPVPGTLAAPSKDRGYIIPKGHYVLASPAVSQLDPEFWKNPREFDPYRWTDPEGLAAQASKQYDDAEGEKVDYGFGAVSKGTESPYQPFGAGRHRCIGEQFAYLQLGVILATFVRKMELKLEKKFPAENFHVSSCCSLPDPTNLLVDNDCTT